MVFGLLQRQPLPRHSQNTCTLPFTCSRAGFHPGCSKIHPILSYWGMEKVYQNWILTTGQNSVLSHTKELSLPARELSQHQHSDLPYVQQEFCRRFRRLHVAWHRSLAQGWSCASPRLLSSRPRRRAPGWTTDICSATHGFQVRSELPNEHRASVTKGP